MGTSRDVRVGIAEAIAAVGLGTYRAAGAYQPGDTAPIYFGRMPSTPDRVIVVTVYPIAAPNALGVQVRVRGAAGATVSAEDLADDVRTTLHGLRDQRWGGTDVPLVAFSYAARMGADDAGRDEVALNFQTVTSDPATSLVDL